MALTKKIESAGPRQDFVKSVAKAIAVMKAFASGPEGLTIADVARRTRLSRAVSRRFLLTLQQLGYVANDDGMFVLTPRVLDLGYAYLSAMRLPDLAESEMEDVVSRLHESCSISVLDGGEVVYVARVPAKRIMSINLAIGSRLPAYATSMGRILLSHLEPAALDGYLRSVKLEPLTKKTVTDPAELKRVLALVRERGWALVDQEIELGVRAVAAPIRDRSGRAVAAINVASHASRVSLKDLRTQHLPVLLQAADRISAMLGSPPR